MTSLDVAKHKDWSGPWNSSKKSVFALVLGMIIAENVTSMRETLTQPISVVDSGPPEIVSFKSRSGYEVQANIGHLRPQSVTFELQAPETVLRLSEVLSDFRILSDTTTTYSGKAVVTGLIDIGTATVCEVALSEPLAGMKSTQLFSPENICVAGFSDFLKRWEKFYRVCEPYKVVVADLQTFLESLRQWLQQVELTLPSSADRASLELEIAHGLRSQITASLTSMFERFEEVVGKIDADLQPVHRAFGQRQLHPYLLCAPFIHRTYAKPLGYAGDYEMMNMIVRNGLEGSSLYAKLVNGYMLDQAPAHAVRNRVKFLCDRINEETIRVAARGRQANIYSIACGPAREVQNFLAECPAADKAAFRLLDFNEETLQYTTNRLDTVRREHHRNTPITIVKNSVQSLLKASGKLAPEEQKYDLIYCSGLYDYLNERLIKALNNHLYDRLRPGGLLIIGNFNRNNPIQRIMEHALEWFLIYRSGEELLALAPDRAKVDDCRVKMEGSATHVFLEVRKPNERS